jgi:hypothetical protein
MKLKTPITLTITEVEHAAWLCRVMNYPKTVSRALDAAYYSNTHQIVTREGHACSLPHGQLSAHLTSEGLISASGNLPSHSKSPTTKSLSIPMALRRWAAPRWRPIFCGDWGKFFSQITREEAARIIGVENI